MTLRAAVVAVMYAVDLHFVVCWQGNCWLQDSWRDSVLGALVVVIADLHVELLDVVDVVVLGALLAGVCAPLPLHELTLLVLDEVVLLVSLANVFL
jgi:hypothetical protein